MNRDELVLSEWRARERLRRYRLPMVETMLVPTGEDVVTAAASLRYPLTVKADHPELLHKARYGAVVNDVRTDDELAAACREMSVRLADTPFAGSDFLLQEYERPGADLLMAGLRDRVFGSCLVVGAGGARVEELARVEYLLERELGPDQLLAAVRAVLPGDGNGMLAESGTSRQLLEIANILLAALRDDPSIVDIEFNPVRISSFPQRGRVVILDALLTLWPDGTGPVVGGAPRDRPDDHTVVRAVQRALGARSAAIIGVSRDGTGTGNRLLQNLTSGGFAGEITVVHPAGGTIAGIPAVTSLSEKDGKAAWDVAFVSVPERSLAATLRMLERSDVGLTVLTTALEAAETASAAELAVAGSSAVILGPNTAGLLSMPARVRGSFIGTVGMPLAAEGSVGLVTQSGSIGSYLIGRCAEESIGVRYWLPTGNEAHVRLDHAIHAMLADPAVTVLGLFVEGVRDGNALLAALHEARRREVTVVAHVTGKTAAGKQAARSHTSALAGDHALLASMMSRAGAVLVQDVDALFDVIKLAAALGADRPRAGDPVAVVATSGGSCTLLAEDLDRRSVRLAPVSNPLRRRLRSTLPAFATVSNPLDVTADAVSRPDLVVEVLRHWHSEQPGTLVLLALGTQSGPTALQTARSVVDHTKESGMRICVSRLGPPTLTPEVVEAYRGAGIAVYESPHRAARAIATMVEGR